jgi:hypothetical protein
VAVTARTGCQVKLTLRVTCARRIDGRFENSIRGATRSKINFSKKNPSALPAAFADLIGATGKKVVVNLD